MALRRRPADQLDLAGIEAEALVGRPALRFDRAVVGQQDALRAAFDDGGRDAAVGDVGEALRREQDRDILLPERLQPLADPRREQRMIKEDPGFVEDEQGGTPVEPLLKPVEEIGEDGRDRAGLTH